VTIQDRAVIAGIAQSQFGRGLAETEYELACAVILAACRDAGVDPGEVDGLVSYTIETSDEVAIGKAVGTSELRFFARAPFGGGAGPAVVAMLAMAVATGQCSVGIGFRSRKRASKTSRTWTRHGRTGDVAVGEEFTRPFGLVRPVDEVAMLTRRYMHEYGATRDHLANVALACRRHANANPAAMTYTQPLTRDEYLSSRWISEPLCLYDNCLETDGALAVVVVAADRAASLPHRPVYVHAAAQGLAQQQHTMVNYFNGDPLHGPSWTCARSLYSRSDFAPSDIDVAQIYDAFTPLVLLSLEGYGLCGRGEAGPFTDDGGIEVGGRLPVNTSGGGLSEAYVHGFNLILEGVRQMRGTSPNQVADAHSCLVTGAEAVGTSAVILRR
jgi:acetyl-CoA acetyltransferase